jgi:hypothetical protein
MGQRRDEQLPRNERAERDCRLHLGDLKRAYAAPPRELAFKETACPRFLRGPATSSGCSSPSAMLLTVA